MTCCYKIPVWLWIFLGLSLVLILLMLLLTIVECIMDERSNTDYGVNGRGGAVPPPNTDYGTYNRPSRQYDEPRFQTPPPRYPTPPPDYDAALNDPSVGNNYSNGPNTNNNEPIPNNNNTNNNNANNNNANVNNNNNVNPTDNSNGIIVFNNINNNDDNVTTTDDQLVGTELERQILAARSVNNDGYDADVDAVDSSLESIRSTNVDGGSHNNSFDSIRSTEVIVGEDDMEACSSTHNLDESLEGESKLTRNNSWETFLRKTFDRNSLKKKFSDFSPSLGIDESLPSATDLTFTDSGVQDGYESDVSTATSSFHCSSWDEDEEVDIRNGKEVVYELNNVTNNSRVPRLQNLVSQLTTDEAKE